MKYKLGLSRQAKRFFKKHHQQKSKFISVFKEMTEDYEKAIKVYDIKKMKGISKDIYRLRIGKYRAIYQLYNEKLYIFVMKVGSLGDIYK